jgi:hypothetical protein
MAPAHSILNWGGNGQSRLLSAGPSSQMGKSMGEPSDNSHALNGLRLTEPFCTTGAFEPLNHSVSILKPTTFFDRPLTTITTVHFSVAFLSAWTYRDSESARSCPLGFGLLDMLCGAQTPQSFSFVR